MKIERKKKKRKRNETKCVVQGSCHKYVNVLMRNIYCCKQKERKRENEYLRYNRKPSGEN